MLSKDCNGCNAKRACAIRFVNVRKGEFVYCHNGDRHLVDCNPEWMEK